MACGQGVEVEAVPAPEESVQPEHDTAGRVAGEAVDPDIDTLDQAVEGADAPIARSPRPQLDTVAVIAAGGALGALARYGAGQLWPTPSGGFPWTTFGINVVGCALIGVLMVVITDVVHAHRLVRPLLGVGVLGGFTTFSTYAVEALDLARAARPGLALAYLLGTLLAAVAAVTAAASLTGMIHGLARRVDTRRRRGRAGECEHGRSLR